MLFIVILAQGRYCDPEKWCASSVGALPTALSSLIGLSRDTSSEFCDRFIFFLLSGGHASASVSAGFPTAWDSFEGQPRGPSPVVLIIGRAREGLANGIHWLCTGSNRDVLMATLWSRIKEGFCFHVSTICNIPKMTFSKSQGKVELVK